MDVTKKLYVLLGLGYVLLAFIISRFPLFDYLGYEFSAAFTFIIPITNGIITFSYLRERNNPPSALLQEEYGLPLLRSIKHHLSLLLIPLFVITVNAVVVKNCSYFEGLLFYLLLPCITMIFCSILAGFCRVVFHRARFIYALILAIILLHPIFIGYTTPQIYSYNFIYGFFPGFSYDEVLVISPALILFRCITLMTAFLVLLISLIILRNTKSSDSAFSKISALTNIMKLKTENILVVLLSIILIVIWFMRGSLGFESDTSLIRHSLGAAYTTDHFSIFYSPASFSREEIRWAAAEHEFRFHQVEAALQSHFSKKIDSYIYPDAETKRRYIGTGTTNIAKPWRTEIHLNKDSWEATLKHELVHVLAGDFGMPIIKAHYHTGLVEGLATAIDGDYGNRTMHEYAAAIKKFGLIKNPGLLITPLGFALHSSSISYVVMGSFCRFLLDRYGIIRFKELYGGKSTDDVYNKSYQELVDEWQHFLMRVEVPEEWHEHVEFYFKRPSIFAKECARTVAKLNQRGWQKLSDNSSIEAMHVFSHSLQSSWNTEAFSGIVRSAFQAALYDTVVQMLDAQWQDSIHRAGLVNLFLVYGDAEWHSNNILSAKEAYERILELDISDRYNETATLRLEAMKYSNAQIAFSDFFVGSLNDSTALTFLENLEHHSNSPLLTYLKARIYFRQMKYQLAIHELDTSGITFEFPILDASKEQLLGEAYFRQKNFQSARMHFWQSLNSISNQASKQKIEDWLERCEWYEANAKKY